jgi:hypothetical protein
LLTVDALHDALVMTTASARPLVTISERIGSETSRAN